MEDTIFGKIVRGEIAADILYQDDLVTAFRDVSPQAPTHVLIVPNRAIATASDVTEADEPALGRLFTAARRIAEGEGIEVIDRPEDWAAFIDSGAEELALRRPAEGVRERFDRDRYREPLIRYLKEAGVDAPEAWVPTEPRRAPS